ncbi:hypothetical protein KM043_017232 [Ampulex compressa]|nr:hypothetical protein KM043_017232 [Ampulex compressa]
MRDGASNLQDAPQVAEESELAADRPRIRFVLAAGTRPDSQSRLMPLAGEIVLGAWHSRYSNSGFLGGSIAAAATALDEARLRTRGRPGSEARRSADTAVSTACRTSSLDQEKLL